MSLGELAERINRTAGDIEGLQEAKLADERTRGLQERISHVTMAQEEERRRTSRELHDGLGPSLAGLGNRLRASLYSIRSDPEEAEREVEGVAQNLKGPIQEIRALSYDLRPAAIDQLGMIGAIRQHLDWFERGAGIRTSFTAPKALAMNSVSEVMVFRIVQECLNNVQKHAEARNVELRLRTVKQMLEVKVSDDGRGFDPHEVAVRTAEDRNLGLKSMRERVELLNGSFPLQASPGEGCQILFRIPLTEVEVGTHSSAVGG